MCRPFEAGHNGPTKNVNSIRDNKVVSSLEQGNYIQIRIGHHFIRALLDSGTHYSLISEKAAKRLHLAIQPVESSLNLFAAEGSAIGIIGSVDLDMVISGLHISHTAYVVNNLCNDQMLLGRSFMAETSMVMDFAQGIATIHSNLVPIKLINKNRKDFLAKTTKSLFMPAYTEALVPVRCSKRFRNCDVILEPNIYNQYRTVAIARVINHTDNCRTFCRVLNSAQTVRP